MKGVNESRLIKSEIRTMRIVLSFFSAFQIVCFFFLITSLKSDFIELLWKVISFVFYVSYILFIWRMPLDKFDKWKEIIMALVFGVFAMWMWIQFNEIENKNDCLLYTSPSPRDA